MRLVCPNCDAEYEVDASAIPLAGRDVQCSNCGHAWFQAHPEVVAERDDEEALFGSEPIHGTAEAEVPDPEDVLADSSPVAASDAAELGAADAPEAIAADAPPDAIPVAAEVVPLDFAALTPAAADTEPVAAVAPMPAARNIDDRVMAVLREEAARETAARRAETPSLETQTEMPLEPEVSRRGVEPVPASLRPRSERLPAIEEINSTLRSTSGRVDDDDEGAVPNLPAVKPVKSGFRQGFLTLVLLGVIILALYVFAPLIGAKVPALAGVAAGYVSVIDMVRGFLDTQIQTLIGMLRGLAGSRQG